MGIFSNGFEKAREERKKQEQRAKSTIWRFFLKEDGDEADVRFLTDEPVNFYEHTVVSSNKGKEVYLPVICTQDDKCPLCQSGDRATSKGAFLIWDMRKFKYTDRESKEEVEGQGQLRLYVQGQKVLSQLDRIFTKYGLADKVITIARTGVKKNTSYMVERGESLEPLSRSEMAELLPEKLRESYNGTKESLYDIIRNALVSDSNIPESEDDDEEVEKSSTANLVGVEDEVKPKPQVKAIFRKA